MLEQLIKAQIQQLTPNEIAIIRADPFWVLQPTLDLLQERLLEPIGDAVDAPDRELIRAIRSAL